MEAKDFLAQNKRRILRLGFPDFSVYDNFSGLLDVNLSETMSDSPDVEIGNLVIPELSVKLEHTNMTNHLGDHIDVSVGLEQNREDVTDKIQAIQEAESSELLSFARGANGCWFVGCGTVLYSCWFDAAGRVHFVSGRVFSQNISAIFMSEDRVIVNSDGRVTTEEGAVYLFFETEPYLRIFAYVAYTPTSDYQYTGFSVTNEINVPEITDPMHLAVVKDIARRNISITRSVLLRSGRPEEQIQVADIRFSRYYSNSGEFVRHALSGEITTFHTASYGEFTLTETTSVDEETTALVFYGILEEIANIKAEQFLQSPSFRASVTFAEVYRRLILWLNASGYAIASAAQSYLNLDKIPFVYTDKTENADDVTVGDLFRELAMLEGGNARMNHDGLLELGWCGKDPVIAVSADTLSSIRIGTERLRGADSIRYLNPQAENMIDTSIDEKELFLISYAGGDGYVEAMRRIIMSFSANQHIPFSADMLAGASPFLRAGDSVLIVNRNGEAAALQVFMQEISNFPYQKSRISTPDGTRWRTMPVDFSWMTISSIKVENWVEYIIDGEIPDTSGMIVTAELRNSQTFIVDDTLYKISIKPLSSYKNQAVMEVSFYGHRQDHTVRVLYPLYTSNGEPLLTANGDDILVKEVE